MSGAAMWLCVLFGTAVLGAGGWAAMKWYGAYAMKRDEEERAKLAAEWKRRADKRKAKSAGQQAASNEEETGENPPMY